MTLAVLLCASAIMLAAASSSYIVVKGIEEQLSGACATAIAAFDEFTALLSDSEITLGATPRASVRSPGRT